MPAAASVKNCAIGMTLVPWFLMYSCGYSRAVGSVV